MALDFAIYEGFRTRPRLDREVAAKRENIQYLQGIASLAQQRQQQQVQAERAVAETTAIYDQIKSLNRDKEALVSLVEEEEAKIISGIAKSGGDPYKYLNSGGYSSLKQYHSNIQNSEQMNVLVANKQKQAAYMEALSKGEMPLPTMMNINGKEQVVSFGQQLQMYENGEIDQLQWRGAQKPVQIDPLALLKIPNPDNPLKSRFVTTEEYQSMLIAKGQDPILASQIAVASTVNGTKRTNLRFGVNEAAIRQRMGSSRKTLDSYDMFTNVPEYFHMLKTTTVAEDMVDQNGNPVNFSNLGEGETANFNGWYKMRKEGGVQDRILSTSRFLTKTDRGLEIRLSEGQVMETRTGQKFRVAKGRGGTYLLKGNPETIMRASGVVGKRNGQVMQKATDGQSYMSFQMSELSDDAMSEMFETMDGEPVYRSSIWAFDRATPGYEDVVHEQEDADRVSMDLLIPISYSYFGAEEVSGGTKILQPAAETIESNLSYIR